MGSSTLLRSPRYKRSGGSGRSVRASPSIVHKNKTPTPKQNIVGSEWSESETEESSTLSPTTSDILDDSKTFRNAAFVEKRNPEKESGFTNRGFRDHSKLSKRLAKSFYYAGKMPSTPRPSFPLTVFAVNAFTNTTLGTKLDTLEFLDLDLASEIGLHACVSPTSLIMTLVYLERLYAHNPSYLKSVKPSELFVVSLLVASKFIQDDGEDCGIYNDEWATSARMETKDVNKLEIEFLTAIDWNVNVSPEEYARVLQNLELQIAKEEVSKRDWLTYTEMEILSKHMLTWNVIWPIVYDYAIKVMLAASITYASLITTLLTTSIVAPQIVNVIWSKYMVHTSSQQVHGSLTTNFGQSSAFMNNMNPDDNSLTIPTENFENLTTQCHLIEESCTNQNRTFNLESQIWKKERHSERLFMKPSYYGTRNLNWDHFGNDLSNSITTDTGPLLNMLKQFMLEMSSERKQKPNRRLEQFVNLRDFELCHHDKKLNHHHNELDPVFQPLAQFLTS